MFCRFARILIRECNVMSCGYDSFVTLTIFNAVWSHSGLEIFFFFSVNNLQKSKTIYACVTIYNGVMKWWQHLARKWWPIDYYIISLNVICPVDSNLHITVQGNWLNGRTPLEAPPRHKLYFWGCSPSFENSPLKPGSLGGNVQVPCLACGKIMLFEP